MADERPFDDALNEWYHKQGDKRAPVTQQVQAKQEESPEAKLFDVLLWEAEYGGDKDKPFYVTAALKLLELWRR